MATAKASKKILDFTNVKDAGAFNPKHKPAGEYLAEIKDVTEEDSKKGNAMWTFVIALDDDRTATYPHRCTLNVEALWKVRNLLTAAGKTVPKKRVGVDPNVIVGKKIGILLEDEDYEGKTRSVISGVFPASDMPADETTKKKTKKAAVADEDVEDEDEDVTEEDTEVMDVDDL